MIPFIYLLSLQFIEGYEKGREGEYDMYFRIVCYFCHVLFCFQHMTRYIQFCCVVLLETFILCCCIIYFRCHMHAFSTFELWYTILSSHSVVTKTKAFLRKDKKPGILLPIWLKKYDIINIDNRQHRTHNRSNLQQTRWEKTKQIITNRPFLA